MKGELSILRREKEMEERKERRSEGVMKIMRWRNGRVNKERVPANSRQPPRRLPPSDTRPAAAH